MENKFFTLILICLLPFFGFSQEKKVVFIILDGIPATELERVETPNLDRISQIGGYARAYTGGNAGSYSETPTISAVGYNSLLTGTWANKHNVWGNGIEDPNYNYWTIFRYLKELRPEAKTSIFSTWEDNRTKLLGEGLPQTGNLDVDYSFDGFELDSLSFPHDKNKWYIRSIDNLVSFEAAYRLKNQAPDLSWVYLEFTDDMGHRFGKSPELAEAIQLADQQVGRIWEAIDYRKTHFGEDWLIWITTDHGRKDPDGKDHGGQSESERMIWMVTNAKNLNERFWSGKAAMVDILPSISRFLDLKIPKDRARELDGVPLIGDISLTDAGLVESEKEFLLNWTPVEKLGKVRIYLSPTNHFSEGGKDDYRLIGESELQSGSHRIPKSQLTEGFFKILIEGEKNSVNVWKLH